MNYLEYAAEFRKIFRDKEFPSSSRRAIQEAAQDLYDYAVMHEDLPKEFENMLNGLAEASGVLEND